MKYVLLVLALLGIAASSLALREHYRTYGDSPCSINERWDCGIVNHSPYAVIHGVPVAVIGRVMLVLALAGLAFSLYLARIEAHVLGVWCVYCAISLATISLMTLLILTTVLFHMLRRPPSASH